MNRFFATLWNPRTRELLGWCLPALVVALALRVLLTAQMPFGYYHADTPDFLTTPESLLLDHRFELHMKKTFLAPLFFTPPFLLHVPALLAIPICQHLLGLALVILVGVLCRLWFAHWKWFVIPLTLVTAANPALLWFEHALLAETVFVSCTVLLAIAGTLYASQQSRPRFIFLCVALFLEAGARPEGKLFLVFGISLVFLLHLRAWRVQLPRLAAILLLAVVADRLTRTSQGGLLLYTSVARFTPPELRCAPGFEPFIAAERADLQARWAEKPSFPKVTDRRIIAAAVEDYLKGVPDIRLADRHRRVNGLCLKLAIETCWRNLSALPAHAYSKFRYTAQDAPNGRYDRAWLFDAQHRAYADEAAHTLRLARGLTGVSMTTVEDMQRFVDRHYYELDWFNAWSTRWFAAMNAWRLPDAHFPGGPSSPRGFISFGVPIYFLLAAAGLVAIALRRGPLQRFHMTWAVMLAIAFFIIMLTANVKPRFRLAFEPFWFIYGALWLETLALGLGRSLSRRRRETLSPSMNEDGQPAPTDPPMKSKLIQTTVSLVLVTALSGSVALAAEESPAALKAQAAITQEAAAKTALAKVPKGKIKSTELEKEHGKLIWSFDITTPNSRNITEVQVDAKTGKIVAIEVETPADQAKEAAADKKEKK